MKTAIYPGSFDPITLGHLNIIKRAAVCFDKLIVCVMVNSEKANRGLFTPEERVELLRRSTARFQNVEVDFSNELLAAYAKRRKSHGVVKGLRAVSDYENELQMALLNRKLNPRLDTMLMPSSAKYTYISSSVVKEMARYGADLSDFVPREIIDDVNGKTLVSASSLEKDFSCEGTKTDAAKQVGVNVAERAKAKGIENVVFDRGGYVYHGRVKALAEGAREGGLQF